LQSDSQQWQLFGLDLARLVRHLGAGWHELLWGEQAGIRRHFDAPVELLLQDGKRRVYVAERPLESHLARKPEYQALQLPDELILFKSLQLPAALELELDEAVALEVQTSSPFPPANTVYGWRLVERRGKSLHLGLCIAARSEIESWLAEQKLSKAATGNPEIWALDTAGYATVLRGFGEVPRLQAYPRTMLKVSAKLCVMLFCLFALAVIPGLVRSLQADRLQAMLQQDQADAAVAQELREQLARGNTQVQALQSLLDAQVDYHRLLGRLSEQTPDKVYLQVLEAEGSRVRLVGLADNAADYMQQLTSDPFYREVKNPSGFTRERRTGQERFVLDMQVAGEVRP
jgi:general secretion pathway protein L